MQYRPPRTHQTYCFYIHGPPSIGKTCTTTAVLNRLQTLHPELDWYKKMGRLSKSWDGYDNRPFVFIDDPGDFNHKTTQGRESVEAFKNVVSADAHTVEIKGLSFPFDSHLVIMASNIDPGVLAETAGLFHSTAVLDCLQGTKSITRKSFWCPDKETARGKLGRTLCRLLARIAKERFDIDVNMLELADYRICKSLDMSDCISD